MVDIAEDRLHIPYSLGPYGRYTFQFNFCYKSTQHKNNSMDGWPPGNYSIYGTEDGCPTGKQEYYVAVRHRITFLFCQLIQLPLPLKWNTILLLR